MFASDTKWSAGESDFAAADPISPLVAPLRSHFAVKFAPALRVTAEWCNLAIRNKSLKLRKACEPCGEKYISENDHYSFNDESLELCEKKDACKSHASAKKDGNIVHMVTVSILIEGQLSTYAHTHREIVAIHTLMATSCSLQQMSPFHH